MKKITKMLIAFAMTFASCAAVCAAVNVLSDHHLSAEAAVCSHEGNHYTLLVPTNTRTGVKEYWVCCKCHQHFTTKTSGTWNDAGQAKTISDSADDRFIAKLSGYKTYTDAQGLTYSQDGTTITKYTAVSGVTEIVVPEGVTSVGTVFSSKTNITKVTLPSTILEVGQGCFQGCTKLKTVELGENTESIETKYNKSGYPRYSAGAFQNCSSLEYLVIPLAVEEIIPYTFRDVNKNCKLFCEASSKPSGWQVNIPDSGDNWNAYSSSSGKPTLATYWAGQWHYDANGVPQAN